MSIDYFEVYRIIKDIPKKDIRDLVIVTKDLEDKIHVYTTTDEDDAGDQETACILWTAYEMYEPEIDLILEGEND